MLYQKTDIINDWLCLQKSKALTDGLDLVQAYLARLVNACHAAPLLFCSLSHYQGPLFYGLESIQVLPCCAYKVGVTAMI